MVYLYIVCICMQNFYWLYMQYTLYSILFNGHIIIHKRDCIGFALQCVECSKTSVQTVLGMSRTACMANSIYRVTCRWGHFDV